MCTTIFILVPTPTCNAICAGSFDVLAEIGFFQFVLNKITIYRGNRGVQWPCCKHPITNYFSSNDPFEIFEIQIFLFEKSFHEAVWRVLIAGDFNGKSLECGEVRLHRRGILVSEMVARNDPIVFNRDWGDYFQPRGKYKLREYL